MTVVELAGLDLNIRAYITYFYKRYLFLNFFLTKLVNGWIRSKAVASRGVHFGPTVCRAGWSAQWCFWKGLGIDFELLDHVYTLYLIVLVTYALLCCLEIEYVS